MWDFMVPHAVGLGYNHAMHKPQTFLHQCLPGRNERFLWLIISLITLAIVSVNALSILTEAERNGANLDIRRPWIDEMTSALFVILLFPPIGWFVQRLPMDARDLKKSLLAHLGLSILFSSIHILGMVTMRKIIYWFYVGENYVFLESFWRDSLYEYRKDIVTYGMFAAILYLVQALSKRETALEDIAQPKRLAFKSGGQAIWIEAHTFNYAKAAGNYVEVFAADQKHLVRLSLSKLEEMLRQSGLHIARIHRSYIVKAAEIVSVTPKGDGDAVVMLKDGTKLPASRRYRNQLAAIG